MYEEDRNQETIIDRNATQGVNGKLLVPTPRLCNLDNKELLESWRDGIEQAQP